MREWNEAVDYIEAHLADGVSGRALAAITLTSEYHFRRTWVVLETHGIFPSLYKSCGRLPPPNGSPRTPTSGQGPRDAQGSSRPTSSAHWRSFGLRVVP